MTTENKNQEKTLATEIIHTLKKIICLLIVTNILTIAGFLWYLSLPGEEISDTNTQEAIDVDNSELRQIIGGEVDGESNTTNNQNSETQGSQTQKK